MNNTTLLEGSSVILGEQNIVHNDDDQASNSEEVDWNNDGDGGYGDNSEVQNDSSDLSIKLSLKHIKKPNKKFRIADVEDDDDRSESCKSDNSHFSQTSSIEPQGDPKLVQFSGSSSLNSMQSFLATAIDLSIKTNKQKNQKKAIRLKAKIWQCWCSIFVSWYFHHFSTS
jgi:hypothetical protein